MRVIKILFDVRHVERGDCPAVCHQMFLYRISSVGSVITLIWPSLAVKMVDENNDTCN